VYRQTMQQAFREVSDALVGYDRSRERRKTQEALVDAPATRGASPTCAIKAARAAISKSWTATRVCFDAELQLVRARLSELAAFVEVYRALGRRLARVTRSRHDRGSAEYCSLDFCFSTNRPSYTPTGCSS